MLFKTTFHQFQSPTLYGSCQAGNELLETTFLVMESSEAEGMRVDTWKMTSMLEVA